MGKSKKLVVLEKILKWMSIKVLRKFKPKVVAITGSVGKTTTKEAVSTLLDGNFKIRRNQKNYNNEVGVPLTIIGAETGGSSIFGWLGVFIKWLGVMLSSKYPEVLILEMGADRPGDIKYLCEFVPIDVGIVTNVGISHIEFFKTREGIAKEKGYLPKSVPVGGLVVLNNDNDYCRQIKEQVKADVLTFGFEEGAGMQASDIVVNLGLIPSTSDGESRTSEISQGIIFKFNYRGKIIPVKLKNSLGVSQVYSILAALSVAEYFKLNLVEVIQKFEDFRPPKGRMNLLKGIKQTIIVDDTYNSAPKSVQSALSTLKDSSAKRKVVVLGDMLELGKEEVNAHRQVGKMVADFEIDVFVAVGDRMEKAVDEYKKSEGANTDKVFWFDNPMEAGKFVQEIMNPGDAVLVKGSQGIRMEKIVEEIMADPEKKEELLVRQDETWKNKDFVRP